MKLKITSKSFTMIPDIFHGLIFRILKLIFLSVHMDVFSHLTHYTSVIIHPFLNPIKSLKDNEIRSTYQLSFTVLLNPYNIVYNRIQ